MMMDGQSDAGFSFFGGGVVCGETAGVQILQEGP
jgi:hypothetical protein